MKRKDYQTPMMEVIVLKQQARLLAGSGLGDLSDYPNDGDPFSVP